jgi:hypothetical protein
MKKIFILFAGAGLFLTSCKKDLQDVPAQAGLEASSQAIVGTETLSGVITVNYTLSADTLYELNGKVYVSSGATLTIPPGTRIEGLYNADPLQASALVITKTGKISCKGQQSNPVIFTSSLKNLPGGRTTRAVGDWGGVVLLGDAPTNKPTTQVIEGINGAAVPAGVDVTYGGTNTNHSAGTVIFTRIEWAGAAIAPTNELNSLTLGGCGIKTGIQYVMLSNGQDDALEVFGGTVNFKYIIANSQNDDAFDFDFGYRGNFQFGVSVRSSSFVYADANGIECDNDATGTTATPITRPELSNLTIVGRPGLAGIFRGARFRRNTDLRMRNSIVMGYPTAGATFESTFITGATQAPAFYRNNATHGDAVDFLFSGTTVGPVGLTNTSASGVAPANWVNNFNIVPHSSYKSSALVYNAAGPLAPAAKPANFAGLTTNFLNVPYIGALGPGSPIRNAAGQITIPNNWVAGSAGAWIDFSPL